MFPCNKLVNRVNDKLMITFVRHFSSSTVAWDEQCTYHCWHWLTTHYSSSLGRQSCHGLCRQWPCANVLWWFQWIRIETSLDYTYLLSQITNIGMFIEYSTLNLNTSDNGQDSSILPMKYMTYRLFVVVDRVRNVTRKSKQIDDASTDSEYVPQRQCDGQFDWQHNNTLNELHDCSAACRMNSYSIRCIQSMQWIFNHLSLSSTANWMCNSNYFARHIHRFDCLERSSNFIGPPRKATDELRAIEFLLQVMIDFGTFVGFISVRRNDLYGYNQTRQTEIKGWNHGRHRLSLQSRCSIRDPAIFNCVHAQVWLRKILGRLTNTMYLSWQCYSDRWHRTGKKSVDMTSIDWLIFVVI
jgi:hypothetical protein